MPKVFSLVWICGQLASVEDHLSDNRVLVQYEDGFVEVVTVDMID